MKSMASIDCRRRLAAMLLIAAAVIAIFDPLIVGCVNAQTVTAMFVFGDSYADTGNVPESVKPPYGETWPGYPAGRFSDGRILTDYIASMINIGTPTPYKNLSLGHDCDDFTSGANFAHGGTGVFPTVWAPQGPTLSDQIDEFQTFSDISCPNMKSLIPSSMALVVMVGNDYLTYVREHWNSDWKDLPDFVISVVKGITESITRLYDIGLRKFAIANVEPVGCIPALSLNKYTECNETLNQLLSDSHNSLLFLEIYTLNLPEMKFTILNQLKSFRNAQEIHFGNNLKPCISNTGDVCPNPENYFFWDAIHPTEAAWKIVTDMYQAQIHDLTTDNGIHHHPNYYGKSLRFKFNSMMM